jgi:hypothetical protein
MAIALPKWAIASSKADALTRLARPNTSNYMQMLSRDLIEEQSDLMFSNLSFVIFNYDRCFEFFMSNALVDLLVIDVKHQH